MPTSLKEQTHLDVDPRSLYTTEASVFESWPENSMLQFNIKMSIADLIAGKLNGVFEYQFQMCLRKI